MIRWIRPRLGTAPYDSVDGEEYAVVDVRHLVDKAGNPQASIDRLVRYGADAYGRGEIVVVTCDFGVSRSNAIAAGILSLAEGVAYDGALDEVRESTGETEIKLDLAETVRAVVGDREHRENSARNVLVTGGSGFLGTRFTGAARGGLNLFTPSRAEVALDDATALDAYCGEREIGQIVHLAYPRVYTNAAAAGESIAMLRCILDVCRLRNVRLVFVSGWVVFAGYATTGMLVDERTPLLPKGVYGEGKFLEEELVRLHVDRGEVDAVVCRLGAVYGPGGSRPRLIRTFYEAIVSDRPTVTHVYSNGRPALDLLYVDDAIDALMRAVERPVSGIFHFGGGDPRTTVEIAAEIASIAGKPLAHEEIAIDDYASNIAFDSAKAKRVLEWTPTVSLGEGLRRTLAAL